MIETAIASVLAFLAALAGAFSWEKWLRPIFGPHRRRQRPFRQVLNFDRNHGLLVVLPTRNPESHRFLRSLTWEDMRAADYIDTALDESGWVPRAKEVKDQADFSLDADHRKNLVAICSSKSNQASAEALSSLRNDREVDWAFRKHPADGSLPDEQARWQLVFNRHIYDSPSYEQVEQARTQAQAVESEALDLGKVRLDDYALIVKVHRLQGWNPSVRILIVAGIRGIGTWGAAKYIRFHVDDLYRRLGKNSECDFGAVLAVTYHNWRIARMDLETLIDLDNNLVLYQHVYQAPKSGRRHP